MDRQLTVTLIISGVFIDQENQIVVRPVKTLPRNIPTVHARHNTLWYTFNILGS